MKKIIRFILRALFVYSIRKLLKGSVPKDKLPGYFTNIKFENDEVYYSYIKDLIMNYKPSDKFIVENTDKYMSCFLRSKWLNPGTIGIMFLSETMGNYYLTECIICTLSSGNYKCLGDVLKLYFPALSPMYNIESVVWRTICAKESILKYITVEDLIEYSEYIEWSLIFTFRLFSLEELKRIDISIPELLSNKYCDLIVKNQPEVVFNKDYQNFILDKLNYSNIDREIFIKIKNKHYRNYNHRSGYFIFYQYKENSSCSGFFGYNYLITSIKTGINDSDDENEEESSNKIIKVAVKLKDFISTGEIDERNVIILKEFNEEDINLTKRC